MLTIIKKGDHKWALITLVNGEWRLLGHFRTLKAAGETARKLEARP